MPGLRGLGIHEVTAQTLVDGRHQAARDGENVPSLGFSPHSSCERVPTLASLQGVTAIALVDIIYPDDSSACGPPSPHTVETISALMVCMRFSA